MATGVRALPSSRSTALSEAASVGPGLAVGPPVKQDPRTIRVAIVDDHRLVSDGLALVLGSQADLQVCGQAGSVADAVPLVRESDPDVVVMDFHLPDGTGLDAAIALRKVQPNARFVFLSRDDSDRAWLAAVEQVRGAFVHKSRAASEVIDAVRGVGNGDSLISPSTIASLLSRNRELEVKKNSLGAREREVLKLMAEGFFQPRDRRDHGHQLCNRADAYPQHRHQAGRSLENRSRRHCARDEAHRVKSELDPEPFRL